MITKTITTKPIKESLNTNTTKNQINIKFDKIRALQSKINSNESKLNSLNSNIDNIANKIIDKKYDLRVNEFHIKCVEMTNHGTIILVLLSPFISFLKGIVLDDTLLKVFIYILVPSIFCIIISCIHKARLMKQNVVLSNEIDKLEKEKEDLKNKLPKLEKEISNDLELLHKIQDDLFKR